METKKKQSQAAAIITICPDLRKRVRVRVAELGISIKSFCEKAIECHLESEDDHK